MTFYIDLETAQIEQIVEAYYKAILKTKQRYIQENKCTPSDVVVIYKEPKEDLKPKAIQKFELIAKLDRDEFTSEIAYLFYRKDLEVHRDCH